jgi:hypothetical protein
VLSAGPTPGQGRKTSSEDESTITGRWAVAEDGETYRTDVDMV